MRFHVDLANSFRSVFNLVNVCVYIIETLLYLSDQYRFIHNLCVFIMNLPGIKTLQIEMQKTQGMKIRSCNITFDYHIAEMPHPPYVKLVFNAKPGFTPTVWALCKLYSPKKWREVNKLAKVTKKKCITYFNEKSHLITSFNVLSTLKNK